MLSAPCHHASVDLPEEKDLMDASVRLPSLTPVRLDWNQIDGELIGWPADGCFGFLVGVSAISSFGRGGVGI